MELVELKGNTDTGRKRQDNQDTFIAMKIWGSDKVLMAVIDGVGGYEGGDKAAAIAKQSIEEYMSSPKGDVLSMLKEAVIFANNKIAEEREKDPQLSQMCCVLTVAVADAKKQLLHFVHVGDTRLYRLREGRLEKITKDHSLVGVQEDAGELTEEEAMQHPNRNIILRMVGSAFHRIDDPEFLDYGESDFLGADILLACSDGLTDMITRVQMLSILEKQTELNKKLGELIALANEVGGEDNITVVLARNKQKYKPAHKHRKTPSFADTIPSQTVQEPAPATTAEKRSSSLRIITAIAVIAIVVILIFIYMRKEDPPQTEGKNNNATGTVMIDTGKPKNTDDNRATEGNNGIGMPAKFTIDSLVMLVRRNNGKELLLDLLPDDSIILSSSIELDKSMRVTGTARKILQPSSMLKNGPAFIVSRDSVTSKRDTVRLKNIVIRDFETGIFVRGKVIVLLDNVSFENVKYPVSYKSKDTTKSSILSFQ